MNHSRLTLLHEAAIEDALDEAFRLLWDPGVRLHSEAALALLGDAGATVDASAGVARIPLELTRAALSSAPASFHLYDAEGNPAAHCGDRDVHFTPGSAAIAVLDHSATHARARSRAPVTADLIRATRLAEALPALDAASTCMVCADVPAAISDLYRLFIVLQHTRKPVVTGAFAAETWQPMYEMLITVAGSPEALAARPIAIFDVCPLSPLTWGADTLQNLIDCARHRVPAAVVPAPLAGVTAPVTLLGAVVQHAAETLSGIVMHQLAGPGAPVVWGGLPMAPDMRTGAALTGAVETVMLNCAAAEVGQYLGLPTCAYLGLSDAKIPDMQAGFETSIGATMGALAGVNLIAGPGMLDFARVFSLEKLVIDAEVIHMVRRLAAGITRYAPPIALDLICAVGHGGEFLVHPHTVEHFREELLLSLPLVDREPRAVWEAGGGQDIAQRARARVEALLAEHRPPHLPVETVRELEAITLGVARMHGMDRLP